MLEKLEQIEKSYDELTEQISQPEFMSDMSAYAKLMKQHRSLGEIVEKYREVKKMQDELAGASDLSRGRRRRHARDGEPRDRRDRRETTASRRRA
jgi:peptide chain release factor 1